MKKVKYILLSALILYSLNGYSKEIAIPILYISEFYDPVIVVTTNDSFVVNQVYEGLYELNEQGRPVPKLVERIL